MCHEALERKVSGGAGSIELVFQDRIDAGRMLGERLAGVGFGESIALALPRGGVPVAAGVADALNAPMDVLVARKLGVPGHSELGFGAIAEGGVAVLNSDLVERLGLSRSQIEAVIAEESAELDRRVARYRAGRTIPDLAGVTAILVDDGLATGYTARAGLEALRKLGASRVVLAVPVGARETVAELAREGYEVICLEAPTDFMAVGQWYRDFAQTSDSEVLTLLERYSHQMPSPVVTTEIVIGEDQVELPGTLSVPANPIGVVVFAHGSGSSRLSPRNIEVARALNQAGLATLLFDLLMPEEAEDRRNVFDIELLAGRLVTATRWIEREVVATLPLFYFGASTGAAAALVAAASHGTKVAGVVSRGGRPDLGGRALAKVQSPVLMIVGGADLDVLDLNRKAAALIPAEVDLVVIPGAGHLFEEPGALGEVSRLGAQWITEHAGRA